MEREINIRIASATACAELRQERDRLSSVDPHGSWANLREGNMFGHLSPSYDDSTNTRDGNTVFTRHPNLRVEDRVDHCCRLQDDITFLTDKFYKGTPDGQHYPSAETAAQFPNCNCNVSVERVIDILSRQADQQVSPKPAHVHHVWQSVNDYLDEIKIVGNQPNSAFY